MLKAMFSILMVVSLGLCQGRYLGLIDEVVPSYLLGSSSNEDIVVQAGEKIELECRSKEPGSVKWIYPRKSKSTEVSDPTAVITDEEEVIDGVTYYVSKLSLPNVTGADTGEYECNCAGFTESMRHVLKRHMGETVVSKRRVYVFVSDSESLFQGEHSGLREPITGKSRSYTFLPCAVNDPNTTVEVLRIKGYGRESILREDGKRYQYHPKMGFQINRLSIRDQGAYTCRATEGDQVEERQYYLHVTRAGALIQKPVLKAEKLSIKEGTTTSFKCQVAVGRDQLTDITWWKQVEDHEPAEVTSNKRIHIEEPSLSQAMCSGSRAMCSFLKHSAITQLNLYIKFSSKLKIDNADKTDSAKYYCTVWSGGQTTQSDIVDLVVTPVPTLPPTKYS